MNFIFSHWTELSIVKVFLIASTGFDCLTTKLLLSLLINFLSAFPSQASWSFFLFFRCWMDNETTMPHNHQFFAAPQSPEPLLLISIDSENLCHPSEESGPRAWDEQLLFPCELSSKRKRRIIAKHVRLSFTITTTNFWRPDMNDCDDVMRTASISPTFPTLRRSLSEFPRRPHDILCESSDTLAENSRRRVFRSAFPPPRSTALSVRHTRSLSVRLSSAQHKSRSQSCHVHIFSRVVAQRVQQKDEKWWKFMSSEVLKFIISTKIKVSLINPKCASPSSSVSTAPERFSFTEVC